MDTRWKDILALVEAKKAAKQLYSEASQMDILTAFEETVKDLEREDAQIKKQERRRTERKNRENYVGLLKRLFNARLINQRTRWRDLVNGFDPATIPGFSVEKIRQLGNSEVNEGAMQTNEVDSSSID